MNRSKMTFTLNILVLYLLCSIRTFYFLLSDLIMIMMMIMMIKMIKMSGRNVKCVVVAGFRRWEFSSSEAFNCCGFALQTPPLDFGQFNISDAINLLEMAKTNLTTTTLLTMNLLNKMFDIEKISCFESRGR